MNVKDKLILEADDTASREKLNRLYIELKSSRIISRDEFIKVLDDAYEESVECSDQFSFYSAIMHPMYSLQKTNKLAPTAIILKFLAKKFVPDGVDESVISYLLPAYENRTHKYKKIIVKPRQPGKGIRFKYFTQGTNDVRDVMLNGKPVADLKFTVTAGDVIVTKIPVSKSNSRISLRINGWVKSFINAVGITMEEYNAITANKSRK